MDLKVNKQKLISLWQHNKQTILIVAAALLLTIALIIVRAGSPFAIFEAEGSILSGNALIKSDMAVSGGKYVEFTAGSTPPPTTNSDYGAGATGASVPVPAGAVSVNPSNIVSEINNNPAGTAFRLADGTYKLGQLPNKDGNKYYGNPADHTKVVFDGEATYSSLSALNPDLDGSHATSGKFYVWNLMDNNVVANMTMRRYRGDIDEKGYGPLFSRGAGGATEVLIQNVELKDNQFSGMRLGSSRWTVRHVTSYHNGQYGLSGSGSDHLVEKSLIYSNGNPGLPFVPRYEKSDRGGWKFVHISPPQIVRNNEVHSHQDNGMWWDGTTEGMIVENNYVHDNRRHGIIFELSLGGVIRNNLVVNNASSAPTSPYRDAGIFSNYGGAVTIEGNTVEGGRNGIILYQPNRTFTPGIGEPICGSIIRDNVVKGNISNAWIGIHVAVTFDGCNPQNTPSQITIENNNEQGSGIQYWYGQLFSPSEWASKGYN